MAYRHFRCSSLTHFVAKSTLSPLSTRHVYQALHDMVCMLRRGAWVLLALLLALPVSALERDKAFSDYVVKTWGVEQGLPQISVLAITQDANGYIWLGTQAGLARFDGTRFQRYSQHDAPQLAANIQALLADDQGRLWIGTARGLLVLEHGQFRTLEPSAQHDASDHGFPIRSLISAAGQILSSGPDGVYAVEGAHLKRLHALPGPAGVLLADATGAGFWVGGEGAVFQIQANDIRAFPLPTAAARDRVTALAWFDGDVWAGTPRGLYRLRQGSWHAAHMQGPDAIQDVEAMLADHDGNLWLATAQHVVRLRADQPPEWIRGVPGSIAIRSMYEDRDGDLWLGSQIEGVARVWNGFARKLGPAQGLAHPLLWSISATPDGAVVVGSSDGVSMWRDGRFETLANGTQLPQPEAYSVLAEADRIWIGTRAGVAVYRHGRVEQPEALAPLLGSQVSGIVRDRAQRLWFASTNGLYRLHADGTLVHYEDPEKPADPRIRLVHETRDGRILLGSFHGLYEWRDGEILATGRKTGLGDDVAITALLDLDDGRWIVGSSSGESLRVFDGTRWHQLDRNRGLPNNIAFFLAEHKGELWVAGMQGVYRLPLAQIDKALADPDYQLHALQVINSGFERSGGQLGRCCNGSGNGRGLVRDGQLWLPTREGVLMVDINTPLPSSPPTVLIEGVDLGSHYIPLTAESDPLTLPLDARTVRFEFAAPSFRPVRVPRLGYRLLGYDPNWHEVTGESVPSASYVNLRPGQYTFEVTDFNRADAVRAPARVTFTVPAHLHETRSFQLLLVLALLGALWTGYFLLKRHYVRRQLNLEQLVHERTRELQIANARLEKISVTDPLTGLHNRRYLARKHASDLQRHRHDADWRSGRTAMVFALLDIDHFKSINDNHGHDTGDRVLVQMADLLLTLRRNGSDVVRWGGEEFLLMFQPLPRGSLARIGEHLCSSIASHVFDLGNGQTRQLTVSVGLVESPPFPDHPGLLSWEQQVTLADRALYQVKSSGRNGWMACRPAPGASLGDDVSAATGDPSWLLEAGILQLYGPDDGPHGPVMMQSSG